MASRFASRLAIIEETFKARDSGIQSIIVYGGPDHERPRATGTVGLREWVPEPFESADDFMRRAAAEAEAAGERFIVFNGMTAMPGFVR